MRKLNLLFAVLFLTGCTKSCKESAADVTCDLSKKAVSGGAAAVASILECSNPMVIEADLMKPMEGLGLCKVDPLMKAGPVSDVVCPMVSSLVVDLAKDKIPQAWGCKAEKVSAEATAKLDEQCKALIKF